MRRFWRQGEPMVWMTGATLYLTLIFTITLVAIVAANGLGAF
jgi:phosphate transport system permease protein